ncbi:hypothetical protein LJK88_16480 [Paenibacillus sp. P26]|nr:hypothetical protein LJK88_16480 [Paenibacillus sp. P26]
MTRPRLQRRNWSLSWSVISAIIPRRGEPLVQVEALAYLTTGCAEPEFERRLYELSTAVTGLAKALEAHSAWEDEAFFPMLSRLPGYSQSADACNHLVDA